MVAFVLAHELVHPPLTWTRARSGGLERVAIPSQTPSECARATVRTIADEYRADHIATAILRVLAGADAEQRGLAEARESWLAEQHRASVTDALDSIVHPGWPDAIQLYRTRGRDLNSMWGGIVSQTEQILTLLAHADSAGAVTGMAPVLTEPAVSSHVAVGMYLNDLWEPIRETLASQPLLPSLTNFAALESELLTIGQDTMLDMWAILGLTFTEHDDRSFYIDVAEPSG